MSSSNLSPTSRFVTTPARCVCAGHHFFVFFLGQLDFGSSKDRRTDRQTHWFNLLYNPGILFDSFIISEFKRLYGKKKWGEWEKGHKSDFEIVGYSSGFLRLAMTFYEPGQTLFSSYVGTMAIPSSSSSSWTIRFVSSWTDRFSSFSSCWIFLVSGIFRLIHHHFHNFFFSLPPSFFIAFISSCCPDSRGGRDSTVPAIGGDVPHRLVLFSPLHFFKTGRWRQTGNSIESADDYIWLRRQMLLSHMFTLFLPPPTRFLSSRISGESTAVQIFKISKIFRLFYRTTEMVVSGGDGNNYTNSSSNGQCLLHVRSRLHQQSSQQLLSPQQMAISHGSTSSSTSALMKKSLPVRGPGDDVVKRTRSMNV